MTQPFAPTHNVPGKLPMGERVYRDCLALNETIESGNASEGVT
jgi:hypothetical protein